MLIKLPISILLIIFEFNIFIRFYKPINQVLRKISLTIFSSNANIQLNLFNTFHQLRKIFYKFYYKSRELKDKFKIFI